MQKTANYLAKPICYPPPTPESFNGSAAKSRNLFSFLKNNSGNAAIEFVFILPIMLMIVFATIEFGNYYIKLYEVKRTASTMGSFIQNYTPNGKVQSQTDALDNAVNTIFASPNYVFCARPATTEAKAQDLANTYASEGGCLDDGWAHWAFVGRNNIGNTVTSDSIYYVAVGVASSYKTITGAKNLLGFSMPDHVVGTVVIPVGFAVPAKPATTCTNKQVLNYDSTTNSYICKDIAKRADGTACQSLDTVIYDSVSSSYICTTCTKGQYTIYDIDKKSYVCKDMATRTNGDACLANDTVTFDATNNLFVCSAGSSLVNQYSADTNGANNVDMGSHDFCSLSKEAGDHYCDSGFNLECKISYSSITKHWTLNASQTCMGSVHCSAFCFGDGTKYDLTKL